MENKSHNNPSKRLYSIEWNDELTYTIQIKNKKTGVTAGFYPEEFIKGTKDFNFETDNFPKYVRSGVQELKDGYIRKLQKIADKQNKK